MSGAVLALLVGIVLGVPLVGGITTLTLFRRYIASKKTAEARTMLQKIGAAAIARYQGGPTFQEIMKWREPKPRGLCPSASAPVPSSMSYVRGKKYLSAPSEWTVDAPRDAGFACLRFSIAQPQAFQYEYEATLTGFIARAHGDLDGDGRTSTFELRGHYEGTDLVLEPTIAESDPLE